MGGRGASSSSRLSEEEIRQRNKEYLAKRMEQGREVLRQSMQRDLDNITPYRDNTSNKGGAVLSNKNDVINFVKKQVNVDLGKAIDENRFSSRSRTYLDIDSSKLSINEFNEVRRLLQYQKGLRFESNGAKNYAIYYQKKKK